MFCTVNSLGVAGINAFHVAVEADISRGMPAFEIVGLPDASVRESRDRVKSVIHNCGFEFPVAHVLINLAPADIKKTGPTYDLPILVGILSASGVISCPAEGSAFVGELSLAGECKGVSGVLSMVMEAKKLGYHSIYIPAENAPEGAVAEGIQVYPVRHVLDLIAHFRGNNPLTPCQSIPFEQVPIQYTYDFSEVKGQAFAKRALEIAAAGNHNLLMVGSPGSGKSMLAKRLPSILPDMTFEEAIETTKIHSIAGTLPSGVSLIRERPFRSPHHSVSPAGLSGGGSIPRPGEISLAHNGVLFLDEFPEFSRNAMEVLRQPMEDAVITISRAKSRLTYPCSVMVIAAMNPCPCGYYGHPTRKCICTPTGVSRYLSRISGPMLDRMDLHVEVMPVEFDSLTAPADGETSEEIRKRVNAARQRQLERYPETKALFNSRLPPGAVQKVCPMTKQAEQVLKAAFERMGLSARAYNRIVKVARTIADLENCDILDTAHIAQALQYRSLDRKYWSGQ